MRIEAAEPTPLPTPSLLPRKRIASPVSAKSAPAANAGALPIAGTLGDRILNALAKKPQSSIELTASLKLEPNQVYNTCHQLKAKKLIENVADPVDGTRRYRVLEAKH